jgi:2-oxoisovalerate dehydrogenase E2 component (dihydrolipoyl transacylase)
VRTVFQYTSERPQWHARFHSHRVSQHHRPRSFHGSSRLAVVKPYLLADIGEGITECQIIQWFVQPGARVAQFDKICEVQSDKAAVEITSRFDGVIKKLYYEADDMAKVGRPLVDIDIQGEISEEDEKLTKAMEEQTEEKGEAEMPKEQGDEAVEYKSDPPKPEKVEDALPQSKPSGKHATLATPAVRHLTKELVIDIADVEGTGKDGRVLKEDVQKYVAARESGSVPTSSIPVSKPSEPLGDDKVIQLSGIQKKMYQTMTHSLSIPHFLYSDNVDFTSLTRLRRSLNAEASGLGNSLKLSALPFIIKAVSLSLAQFPSINAHLDTSDSSKLKFTYKASHNIGFAVDTPQGLLVPVIKNVQSLSIASLAAEINRLGDSARNNKLTAADLSNATMTVSNIGAIGGTTVAPVIVSPQVAIVGVGKARAVPAFAEDGSIVRREEAVFSWSADHRVVDGATVARCAEMVKRYVENVEKMLVKLR